MNEFHQCVRIFRSTFGLISLKRKERKEERKRKKNSMENNWRFNYSFETIRRNRKKSGKGRDTKLRSDET